MVVCHFLAWEQAIGKVCLPLPKQTRAERDVTGRWEERLSKGPSEEVWEGLWAWLGRQREKDVDIEALEGALVAGGWSDGMRVAPLRWLVRVLEGEAPRALRLARSLVLRGDFAQKEMLGRFLRTPVLSGICGLTLSESEEGNALLRELAKMREMARIRYLSLIENGVDGKGLKALLESPHRGSWEELTLQEPLDEKAVMALAGAPLTGLRVLGLRGSRLSVGLCDLLAEAGWVEGVERLDISENGLDEEALRALFRGKWSNVSVLWAEDLGLEVGEVKAMAEGLAGSGACLRDLSLCGNPLGSEGIAVLLGSEVVREVRSLRLAACEAGEADWSGLGKGGVLFDTLDVSENQITGASLRSLVASETRGARELFLDGHGLGLEGLRALAGWTGLSETQFLGLDGGVIGDEGASVLGGSPFLGSVRFLRIHGADVGGEGLRALLGGLDRSEIEGLTLGENPIGKELGAIFAECGELPKMQELWLSRVGAEAASLRGLEKVRWGGLRRLGLSGNALGDEGIEVLLGMPWIGGVEEWVLQEVGLTDKGARLLADAASLKGLSALDIAENEVGDRGIQALARSGVGARLRWLRAGGNSFAKSGEKALWVLWEKGCEIDLGEVDVWEEEGVEKR